jgi:ADP-ribose pyrophosphatase YjhB (NUDIX family)
MTHPKWLEWAQQLQAHAQNGLTYTKNPFDAEHYRQIKEIAAEILATYTETEMPVLKDLFDSDAGYLTPKLDIRGVIFQDDKILLVKERSDERWTLPGGWVDINEPPSEAVEREVREESGYQVRAARLMALYDRNKHGHPAYIYHLYKLYIQCDLIGGEPQESLETSGAQFFAENDYPELSIGRTTPEVLGRLFHLYRNPNLPAEFD